MVRRLDTFAAFFAGDEQGYARSFWPVWANDSKAIACPERLIHPQVHSKMVWRSMDDHDSRLAWFKTMILPHEAALRRHLRNRGIAATDVDDLVAEAMARAYQIEDRDRIVYGRSYLFSIARNLILDAARRHKVVAFHTFADLEALNLRDEGASVESATIARDELRRLQKVVERMPPRPRQVFLLRRLDGLRVDEVADRLSLSVSTVEKHFARAMALLTEAMAEQDPVARSRAEHSWQSVRKTR